MDYVLFIKGIVIGVLIAVPVGPVAVLCIQRTLLEGRRYGLLSGLGAALADTLYGAIAALGVGAIAQGLLTHEYWFRLFGGMLLIFVGIRAFKAKVKPPSNEQIMVRGVRSLTSAFLITLTNPMTVIAFMTIFAAAGVITVGTPDWNGLLLIAGVFLGSGLWWTFLTMLAAFFRNKIDAVHLPMLNRISGFIIITFAVGVIVSSFFTEAGRPF
jgi:threonine/homoserine/homoserine lactone efflux protein